MLINSEGKPALLYGVVENDSDNAIWHHCFGDAPILDNKKNRAVVVAILAAHNIVAQYVIPLGKRSK